MNHYGVGRMNDAATALQQREIQIAVFAPGGLKAFVEPADLYQRRPRAKTIRGDELAVRQARRVALVVGRRIGQRHFELAPRRIGPGLQCRQPCGKPAGRRQAIVVGEGDRRSTGRLPADVARGRRSMRASHGQIANRRPADDRPRFYDAARFFALGIIGDKHLIAGRIETLLDQRL